MSPITHPCPHCRADYDISTRIHGDRVWCRFCGKWFSVVMRLDGSTNLAKCDAPPGMEAAHEPTADAALVAELSALRAELEAVKGRMDRQQQLTQVLHTLASVINNWNDLAEDGDRGRDNAGLCLTLWEDGSGRIGTFHVYDDDSGTFSQLTMNIQHGFNTVEELVSYLLDWVPESFEVPE